MEDNKDQKQEGKSWWRTGLNKVQDFVADPNTRKFAQTGKEILNVAATIGQANLKGPLGVAGAAVGVVEAMGRFSDNKWYDNARSYLNKNGFTVFDNPDVFEMLFQCDYFSDAEHIDIQCGSFETIKHTLLVKKVDNGEVAVILDESDEEIDYCYVKGDLSEKRLLAILWELHGEAVTLSHKNESLVAKPIKGFTENDYIGPIEPREFLKKIRQYQGAGLKRAYLIVGPPGTGKTTFCHKLAQEMKGKIIVVTPDLLSQSWRASDKLNEMIKAFQPGIVLFEDVDRIRDDGLLLSMMDNLRNENPEVLVLSTANHPDEIADALKRPGRLGARMEFPAPDVEWRKKVIELYSKKIGLDRDITHLAEEMECEYFTHDYIRDVCEQALVETDEDLKIYIKFAVENLKQEAVQKDYKSSNFVNLSERLRINEKYKYSTRFYKNK